MKMTSKRQCIIRQIKFLMRKEEIFRFAGHGPWSHKTLMGVFKNAMLGRSAFFSFCQYFLRKNSRLSQVRIKKNLLSDRCRSIGRKKYQTMGSGPKASLYVSGHGWKTRICSPFNCCVSNAQLWLKIKPKKCFQNEGVGNVTKIRRESDKTIHLAN